MAKLDYRSPGRRADSVEMSEFVVPLALLVIGLIMYGVLGFMGAGVRPAFAVMSIVFVIAAAETVLGIGVAYAVAAMLSTGFGEFRTAILKLAGVIVFSSALGAMIPCGWIAVFAIYLGLLVWQFEIELYEAVVFAVLLGLVRIFFWFFIAGML